ncbi:hypothetical protein TcWFU_004769 [Taenia crassiceps]|uniref:ADAM10 endopeptidase n=1 Tax=Taenia crassiceps TaxID=6207 RepID=A0ABR4QKW9_9CEST
MQRRLVCTSRAIALLKLALLALVVIDLAHLTYEYRLKAYVFSFLASKFTVPSVTGSPHVCENNSWWFKPDRPGPEPWQRILKEEQEFPLAYTIMAFERPDQVWRLLRSIYRPQNYYCIHFDKKSPELYKKWLHRKISVCIPPEVSKNVFFISSISVYHSYMSVLEADLACMRALWQLPKKESESKTPPWKYLINLTGQEFPLKNNLELVRILNVLNNANLIQQERFFYVRRAWRDPPHGLQLHKGAVHIVVTWDFVNFLFTDQRVKDLLDYLPEVGIPDEALFSTVNHNAILNAPGNFPYGDEVYRNGGFYVNRWKHFFPEECSGVWRHAVCIFDLYGMRPLFTPDSPYLFVNKFVMHINAPVLDVTERWFYNWQEWYYRHVDQNVTNLDFFRNLPQLAPRYKAAERSPPIPVKQGNLASIIGFIRKTNVPIFFYVNFKNAAKLTFHVGTQILHKHRCCIGFKRLLPLTERVAGFSVSLHLWQYDDVKPTMVACGASCLLPLILITSSLAERAFVPQIGEYEELNYPALRPPPRRSKRSMDQPSSSFFFHAFGQNFSLVIYRDEGVLSPRAVVVAGGQTRPLSGDNNLAYPVRGFLKSHPTSLVYGSVVNGVFRGTIVLNANSLGLFLEDPLTAKDVYFVEPAGNFLPDPDFHSVIYRANRTSGDDALVRRKRSFDIDRGDDALEPAFCGHSNPEIVRRLRELSQPALGPIKRFVRSVDGIRGQRRDQTATPVYARLPSHSGSRLAGRPISTSVPESSPDALRAGGTSSLSAVRPAARSYDAGPTSRVCNLYLQSDTFLWDHVIKLPHIRFNRDLAIKEITSIFTQHVQGAQAIYQYTNFKDSSGRYFYRGVGFRVDRVLINITEEDCHPPPRNYTLADRQSSPSSVDDGQRSSPPPPPSALPRLEQPRASSPPLPRLARGSYSHENPFCSENVDVTNFLNLNSYINHDDFCLAYVFTYRDFTGGTLGLAWVAELGGSGGVCEKHRLMREGSHTVKKSLNTGVVTLLNYGTRVSMKISQLTFAHEMGHNLGAKHDDDFKEETPACLPSVDDPKGNYIMFASATGGDKENNNKFSVCSVNSIARLLHQVLKGESNCFFTSNGSFCGNRLTEEGEQCDCGFTREDCDDVCCYPKDSREPCKLKTFANVGNTTVKVRCSPTAGECCTSGCQYRDSKHLCRSAGECHKASYCSGNSAQCPPPVNIPDGTPCMNHTRICKLGECLGSVCERIPGWQECSLSRGEDITPEMMCYVACRNIHNDTPCISTIQLETDESLRKAYPRLAAELLQQPGGRAVRLQPGTPCDNYRGYCDVFFVCRSVEVEGPLARLHKLLFSPQMLSKVKTWITVHWWAMLLISFASVASMIIFMRLCSYSTPSSRAYHYHQQQLRGPLPMLHSPPSSLTPRPVEAAASRRQPQGMPREHFVPPFRLKRRRTIDPVNGVERHVSELIPASSVPVPYHRIRGDGVGSSGGRSRPHPKKDQTKARPVSVVVYPQPALPSHVRDLPIHQQQQSTVSVAPLGHGSRSAERKRPLSFVVVGTVEATGRSGDNPSRSTDDENLLLLLPPDSGSPPPVYSPRRNIDQTNE